MAAGLGDVLYPKLEKYHGVCSLEAIEGGLRRRGYDP